MSGLLARASGGHGKLMPCRALLGALNVALVAAVGCAPAVRDGDAVPEIAGAVHRFIEADGVTWHAFEAGRGEPVVLLHGMPETAWAWRAQIEALAAEYRVLALDLKGFGGSDKPEGDYSFAALAAEVGTVLEVAGVERFHLVGHDWGALVAARLAADQPMRVSTYTHISAPLSRLDLSGWPDYRDFHDDPESVAGFLRSADVFVNRVFERHVYGGLEALPETLRQRHIDEFGRRGVREAVGRYFRDLDLAADWTMGPRSGTDWSRLTMPVQILVGARDYRVPFELFRDAATTIPGFRRLVVVDETGHYPAEERPDRITAGLQEHFAER